MNNWTLEPMTAADWEQVRTIYVEGIATGNATFETEAPTWDDWNATHHSFARVVLRSGETVLGWAALSPVSRRRVYAGVAEVSVYVGKDHQGKGLGQVLLGELIKESENNNIWTLQAGIFVENEASIRLHKRNEFREVGRRCRIGQMESVWRDTVFLERRSTVVGN